MPRVLRPRKEVRQVVYDIESDDDDNGTVSDTSQSTIYSKDSSTSTKYSLKEDEEELIFEAIDKIRKKTTQKKTKRRSSTSSNDSESFPTIDLACERIIDSKFYESEQEWNEFFSTLPQTSEHTQSSILRKRCPEYFQSFKESNNTNSSNERYLIKWSSLSYIHASWEEKHALEALCYKHQGKKYWEKRFEQLENDGSIDISQYYLIERVLDIIDNELLIKWMNLGYEDCTYEYRDDINLYCSKSNLISKLKRHKKRAFVKPRKNLTTYTSKMLFKNDNELRPYQVESVEWLTFNMIQGRNSILADEMGLGKTLQAICFMHRLCFSLKIQPRFLVIAPLATLENWIREIEAWTDFYPVCFHGSKYGREIIKDHELTFNFNIIVTNYETALQELSFLGGFDWNLVVIDEAHRLKNDQSKLTVALRKRLQVKRLLLLTGTPIQNNLRELWTLLNFIDEKNFDSWQDFEEEWEDLTAENVMDKFQDMLRPYMLRRVKHDVEKLPPKEDTLIEVEMTTLQKRFYRAIYEKNRNYLRNATKKAFKNDKLRIRNGVSLRNIAIQLRKCCNHPFLLNGVEEIVLTELKEQSELLKIKLTDDKEYANRYSEYNNLENFDKVSKFSTEEVEEFKLLSTPKETLHFEKLIRSSGKLILLDKLLPKLKQDGHRILLFSQWVRVLDILEDYLRGRQYAFERIDGTIRNNKRQLAIDRFNNVKKVERKEDTFVFLLSTRACGQGINLTSADTVILYDGDWNPQNDIQALARCHRIGQTKTVRIYRLVTARSYEETMFFTASKKLGLDMAITSKMETKVDGKHDSIDSKLSKAETERLIKYGAFVLADENSEIENKFLNEDIDHILKNRAINLNKTSSNNLKKLTKAKFGVNDANNDLDISDPAFWEKIVGVEGFDEKAFQHENILHNKRKRKHVIYNTDKLLNQIASEGESDSEFVEDGNESESTVESTTEIISPAQQLNLLKTEDKSRPNKKKKEPERKKSNTTTEPNRPTQPQQQPHFFSTLDYLHSHLRPMATMIFAPKVISQWFCEVDPISGLIYRPAVVGATVCPNLPATFDYLVSFSTHSVSHVAKRDHSDYLFGEFYKYGFQDKLFTSVNLLPKITYYTLSTKSVISSQILAKVLDYVVCFRLKGDVQSKILEQINSTGFFQGSGLQPEINEIVKAAAIYLILIKFNFDHFLSQPVNLAEKPTNESKDVQQQPTGSATLIPLGFISNENTKYKDFKVEMPMHFNGSYIKNTLIRLGYKYIAALFLAKLTYPVPNPVHSSWLITLAFDIVWNIEREYILKAQGST